mgnify:CR=1 FL=1
MLGKIRGQSTAEYAVVLSLVIAAVIGMQIYVKRGLQARVKAGTDSFTSVQKGTKFGLDTVDMPGYTPKFAADGGGFSAITAAKFGALTQYEPYYQESSYDTYSENIEQEHMGDGKVVKEKVSDVNVRKAGGYQRQRGSVGAGERDDVWETAAFTAQ